MGTALALWPAAVLAQVPDYSGARAIGMGGALRAAATGDAALQQNPAGMSLIRSMALEGGYQLTSPTAHRGHLSVVDSTSPFNVAAGVYYTYVDATPSADARRTGHEGGLALSVPFGDKVYLGAMGKYLRLNEPAAPGQALVSGITVDVGAIARPLAWVTVAAAGYNLRELATDATPLAAGFGVALTPIQDLLVTFDGLLILPSDSGKRERSLGLMGGVEYLSGKAIALRAGGGQATITGNAFASVGLSALSEVGAVDVGARQDLSGDNRGTWFGVSLRFFRTTM